VDSSQPVSRACRPDALAHPDAGAEGQAAGGGAAGRGPAARQLHRDGTGPQREVRPHYYFVVPQTLLHDDCPANCTPVSLIGSCRMLVSRTSGRACWPISVSVLCAGYPYWTSCRNRLQQAWQQHPALVRTLQLPALLAPHISETHAQADACGFCHLPPSLHRIRGAPFLRGHSHRRPEGRLPCARTRVGRWHPAQS